MGGHKEVCASQDEQLDAVLDPDEEKGYLDRQSHRSKERRYTFDVAFGKKATNRDVYNNTARDLIGGVLSAHNGWGVHYRSTPIRSTRFVFFVFCVSCFVFRVSCFVFRVSCFVLRVSCFVLRVSCFVLRASCFVLRV